MDKLELDKIEIHDPCEEGLQWVKTQKNLAEAWEACERGDWMFWYLRQANLLTKPQSVELAIKCAARVLSIFEKKYPNDKRPHQAIEIALKWPKEPTEENKKAADAYAAAAAYADAAAAAAAAAADAAADAAAAAAADAAAAAYAAAYADAAKKSERKVQAEIIRAVIPNPFKN